MGGGDGTTTPLSARSRPSFDGRDEPEVSQSLVGLMGAFDKLKEAVGYSGEDNGEFAALEHFVQEIENENAQLRMHAVEAIQVASQLREENSNLLDELTHIKMLDMVEQAASLDKVTLEYDQEVMAARVEQAEAVLEEVENLRVRVDELEEENTGLTEMLNELRQTQQQLNRLQMMEHGEGRGSVSPPGSAKKISVPSTDFLVDRSATGAAIAAAEASASPTKKSAIEAASRAEPTQQTPVVDPRLLALTQASGNSTKDPVAVAEALAAVAGPSEGGVAAAASRMLRDYATIQITLEEERTNKKDLEAEVKRLNEITTSKTFKAPSAWAERELKYRQERERWEETRKEAERRMAKLEIELESLRGTSGAAALERRVEELEARLLESERDRDTARAALHEMELTSRANVGEFSSTGVKPYSGPKIGESGEVQQVVSALETSAGSPVHPSPAAVDSYGEHLHHTPRPYQSRHSGGDSDDQIKALQLENIELKTKLELAAMGIAVTPEVRHSAGLDLTNNTATKAKVLEDKIATAQLERADLVAELQALKEAAATRGAEEAQRVTLQLRIAETETRTEVALLQHGVDADSAKQLAGLAAQLRDARLREQAALLKLEKVKTGMVTFANATSPAGSPRKEKRALEKQVQAVQDEQKKIQDEIEEIAVQATVVPELLHAPVVPQGEFAAAESLPENMERFLEQAAAATPPSYTSPEESIPAEAMERIETLQMQLRAAEQAISALETGGAPIQMHISVPETPTYQGDAPVQMRIAVSEGPTETRVQLPITLTNGEEALASIRMPIHITDSSDPGHLSLNLNVSGDSSPPPSVRMPINIAVTDSPSRVHMPINLSSTEEAPAPIRFAINVNDPGEPVTRVHLPITVAGGDGSRSPSPVRMAINVSEPGAPAQVAAPVHLAVNVASDGAAPVHMPINVTGGVEMPVVTVPINILADPKKEQRMKQLEALLQAANEEEERLRRDLEMLVPVKLNFNLPGDESSRGGKYGGIVDFNPDVLDADKAEVEAAWENHVKSTDVASLIRSKVELETQCQMLHSQLNKAQGALAEANREKEHIQESIDDVMKSGDVGLLAGLREGLKGSTARMMAGGRNFKVFGKRKGGKGEKEEEPTALRKSLARVSKKFDTKKGNDGFDDPSETSPYPSTSLAAAAAVPLPGSRVPSPRYNMDEDALSDVSHRFDVEEVEREVGALRDENSMLMAHLVNTKVRLAEVEGEVLESRRSLLRSREKQMQLARQIMELQAAEEPSHETVKLDMSPPNSATGEKAERRRSSIRLPGLG